jgi:hypothetical protein
MHNHFLFKIITAPFVVLLLHITATVTGWYEMIWWLDKPLHLAGGIAVAISSYYLIKYFESAGKLKISWLPIQVLGIFAIVALAAVSWEFLEFYLDKKIFAMHQPSLYDTMVDLIMGMFGGTITGTLMSYFGRSAKK